MRRVDHWAASNLKPTVERNYEDGEVKHASETSAIRISEKAEGVSQEFKQEYSNAERLTVSARPVTDNAPKLLIDAQYVCPDNDVEEYADDVRLTPSAPPCDDDERNYEDGEVQNASETSTKLLIDAQYIFPDNDAEEYADDVRLTPSAPPRDDDESSMEHALRQEDDGRLTPTASPRNDEDRSIGHAPHQESVEAVCRYLISRTQDENWIGELMLNGLSKQEIDVVRWQNPQLQRHYNGMVYQETVCRDLEKYQPGFYFVSNKNIKAEHEVLHCTAIIVVPREGKPRYFDSHGNVPDELRDRVEWSPLRLQKNVNTCVFHCFYVVDMWTKFSTLSNLPESPRQTFKEFIDGLYSPIKQGLTPNDGASADNVSVQRSYSEEGEGTSEHVDGYPNFDPDINVMLYFKKNLLPALKINQRSDPAS